MVGMDIFLIMTFRGLEFTPIFFFVLSTPLLYLCAMNMHLLLGNFFLSIEDKKASETFRKKLTYFLKSQVIDLVTCLQDYLTHRLVSACLSVTNRSADHQVLQTQQLNVAIEDNL